MTSSAATAAAAEKAKPKLEPQQNREEEMAKRRAQQQQEKEQNELAELEGFLSMLKQKKKVDGKDTDQKKTIPERPKLW